MIHGDQPVKNTTTSTGSHLAADHQSNQLIKEPGPFPQRRRIEPGSPPESTNANVLGYKQGRRDPNILFGH